MNNTLKLVRLEAEINQILFDAARMDTLDPVLREKIAKITPAEGKLRLVLVGAYSTGKSTIVKALSGDESIKTSGDICTDEPETYQWGSIEIVDTPGVLAGLTEHDAKTETALQQADLVLFVISSNLFTPTVLEYFRTLAYDRGLASKMALVVNRMSESGGDAKVVLDALSQHIEPMSHDDFRTTCIDAKYHRLLKDEEDEEIRETLARTANFDAFIDNINAFIKEKGVLGRAAGPANQFIDLLREARADIPPEGSDLGLVTKTLQRKRQILARSKRNLMNEMMDAAKVASARLKEPIEELILDIEEMDEAAFKSALKTAENTIDAHLKALAPELQSIIDAEVVSLTQEMETLESGQLYHLFSERVGAFSNERVTVETELRDGPTEKLAMMQTMSKELSTQASNLASLSTNSQSILSSMNNLKGFSDTQLHDQIKNVGHFFGVKFKPWEVTKITKKVGMTSGLFAVVLSAVNIGLELKKEEDLKKHENAIRALKRDLRAAVASIRKDFDRQFNKVLDDTMDKIYTSELDKVESVLKEITDKLALEDKQISLMNQLEKQMLVVLNNANA